MKYHDCSDRSDLFVTTKHWRNYHGYDSTWQCFQLSLQRLQLTYVDLYLMHWPGPAYNKTYRKSHTKDRDDTTNSTPRRSVTPCYNEHEMIHIRSETWRAMEDILRAGYTRAIGVSNMTIQHLQTLQQNATIWPPAVNQIEFQ
jgi:diketogulonate reductase-like aldo/keto reductase